MVSKCLFFLEGYFPCGFGDISVRILFHFLCLENEFLFFFFIICRFGFFMVCLFHSYSFFSCHFLNVVICLFCSKALILCLHEICWRGFLASLWFDLLKFLFGLTFFSVILSIEFFFHALYWLDFILLFIFSLHLFGSFFTLSLIS